ncbi:MAG TPA: hypothetical protein VL970_10190 [Candidatus Acidoferrales bacterium]|nr:hypothetical protein [Candidatus Acidoferrales bacterium]
MNGMLLKLGRLQRISVGLGTLGLAGGCAGFLSDRHAFFVSYLFAFAFWVSLSLGSYYLGLIHYLTAGRWGLPARRIFEAGFMTLPLMALFIVPLFFGLHELYPWARPEAVAADKILQGRAGYNRTHWFIIRAMVLFVIWIIPAVLLRKWSLEQDATAAVAPTIKIRTLSGPAVAIVPLAASFAFVDWVMSIEADWYSTIFPVIMLAGQILLALAFGTLFLAWTHEDPPFRAASEKVFPELASLLLALVMFWTYVAFSQILITYSGNLPQQIGWYLRRIGGGWLWLVGFVTVFHFFAPFFLLLFRKVKRNVLFLAAIAAVVFAAHAVEMFWIVAPAFYPRFLIHWTDFAAWFGLGGIWLAVFCQNMKRHPLLARNDPRLKPLTVEVANAR